MTASVVIKLKRSLSKKQNGENESAEQQTTKSIEDVSNVASEIRTKMPIEKSSEGLNQSNAIPEDVTLEDIKNESVDIIKEEIEAVERGITSVAEGVGKTSAIVNEKLMTAEQQGIQTLDSVSLGAKKLKNETFAIQEEIASTATGVLSSSAGVPQTLVNTTKNITAINDVVGITTDMIKKPEDSVEKLKAETEEIRKFTQEESTKIAADATATAEAATSKAKEGVNAAKKRSGGIIQIGVRLIRLAVRVANKNKKQTSESASSGSGQLSAPATVVSTEGVTQPATDSQGGGPDVAAALGSLTSGVSNSSKDPASTVKKVVGLLVKVVRMVKKKKNDGGDMTQGSVNLRVSVVSPDGDSDSVYYDCDSEMPSSTVCPRKPVSVSATGTQTTMIQDSSASNFISREEFEELKRALSLGALSSSVPRTNIPLQSQSQNVQKSFEQVVGKDFLLCRGDEKIPKYNTLPDVRKTSKIESAYVSYESPSTSQLAEEDIEQVQSIYLNNESGSQVGFRSTRGSLQEVKVEDETKVRGSSEVSPISLMVTSSLPPHPYFHGNNHKRYSSFDLNAPVVLHAQRQEGLQAASVSDANLRCRSEYSDHSHFKDRVNIQSTGNLVFPTHTAIDTNSFKVVPRKPLKSSSLDIEKQQITDPIPSCCTNGYTASASESSEVEVTKCPHKKSSTSVHFVDEKPISGRIMKQSMSEGGLARGHFEDHRITSQPDLSFQKNRPASVVVDIPEPKLAIAFNDNRPGKERESRRSKKHRQKQSQNYENTNIINEKLVGRRVERAQVNEVSKTRIKTSEIFPLSSYNKSETKILRDSTAGKKRLRDKHRSSKRKTSFSRSSKKYRLKQIGEHRYIADDIQNRCKYGKTQSAHQISEKVAVGRNENVYRRSGEFSRHSKFGNDSQLHDLLVPNHSATTDDVGGESSRETSDDFDPNYESTDYV